MCVKDGAKHTWTSVFLDECKVLVSLLVWLFLVASVLFCLTGCVQWCVLLNDCVCVRERAKGMGKIILIKLTF